MTSFSSDNHLENAPIFPLRSIVLPGGLFPLRIFERRYLDMVTECIKNNEGFCISLVKKEEPDLYVKDVFEYGSWVEITDWNKLQDGLLGITVEGKNIVKTSNTSLDKENLLRGKIEKLGLEKEYLIPQQYIVLSKFYKKIYPNLKDFMSFKQERFSDASWIGYRLTELLPIELELKADLISTSDAIERLKKINQIMTRLYGDEFTKV
ncbi:MAG: LON peptidase substrate-binding domain-containing protein [Pseudomonadota bacterium]|nr:LON peptidase substrate-binding domain-containing protein [Pseudomonadota bacterium]